MDGTTTTSTSMPSAPQCPMRAATTGVARCPIREDPSSINPLNNIPDLPQSRAPNQLLALPTDRETSSIPRPLDATYGGQRKLPSDDALPKWEYPSPQQFYNALMRKGWNTPEEQVEAMVLLHNRLNEDAWVEILRWETRFGGGPSEAAKLELVEFAGIHTHMTYKAQAYQYLRRYFPSYLTFGPPFDRHDWIVQRQSTGKKLRYIIDYYSSRKSPWDEPKFHLDVRPASDSVQNVAVKIQYLVEAWIRQLATHSKLKVLPFIHLYPVYIGFCFLLGVVIATQALYV